jgi:hypothetical protein
MRARFGYRRPDALASGGFHIPTDSYANAVPGCFHAGAGAGHAGMDDLVVDQCASEGEGSSHRVFLFPHDVCAMVRRQISAKIISTISRTWHFTTKSGGI